MGQLDGRIAIITGASSGIGYGTALRFAMEGANVIACARREENLKKLSETAKERGYAGTIIPQVCDVAKEEDMDAAVKAAIDNFGTVHILVNIAQGALRKLVDLESTKAEDAMELFQTGPIASMIMMQKCLPYMRDQHYGRIINCSSPAVKQGAPGMTSLELCKASIDALTRNASQEWGPYGITTNNFLPTIKTENFDMSERGRAYAKMMAEQTPVRFFGTPFDDCAPMLVFLASEEAAYINGQAICIDGGKCLIY